MYENCVSVGITFIVHVHLYLHVTHVFLSSMLIFNQYNNHTWSRVWHTGPLSAANQILGLPATAAEPSTLRPRNLLVHCYPVDAALHSATHGRSLLQALSLSKSLSLLHPASKYDARSRPKLGWQHKLHAPACAAACSVCPSSQGSYHCHHYNSLPKIKTWYS